MAQQFYALQHFFHILKMVIDMTALAYVGNRAAYLDFNLSNTYFLQVSNLQKSQNT